MLSKAADAALRDIQHHIELATGFIAGIEREAFTNDVRTVYAVTRCLEIISEASRRLPDDLKARHASIPGKQIAGAGNIYQHDYEDVAAQFVWNTVHRALPPLRTVIAYEIARSGTQT